MSGSKRGRSAITGLAAALATMLAATAIAGTGDTSSEPAIEAAVIGPDDAVAPASPPAGTRDGREIFESFRDGLDTSDCETGTSARWTRHFAHAPDQLAAADDGLLPLFGYVVDALRESHLPTEYALIPFIESGYKPGARSPAGPVGMWQMVQVTARNHKVPISAQYDGRLSPVDSTRAAVRYLKTLHGMFAGDWRLAVMAYNAGEYRVFGALRKAGLAARDAQPEQLPGMPAITQAYVRKIHALSCLMLDAADDEAWLQALERPVPQLEAVPVPAGVGSIDEFARRSGQSPARLKRLNPAHAGGHIRQGSGQAFLLATATSADMLAAADDRTPTTTVADASVQMAAAAAQRPQRHTVARGENPWLIARRYGLRVPELLRLNGLTTRSVLRPGQQLMIDPLPSGAE
ncbi:lytic transglycosylase domain-containing protein [Marilutibacter alkalisoli]|uniref:LysM peptidoglycan-binding domain-containing protein n=1 Tax=Marilutibacter alkalisoli TaxID=2591633 RepID=A0A514BT26_9GAMM|nr:lytic transglycosylase domain-containing protein [Lysobacter alkalisoli]QDH70548.1 LysM peptidoglycan-binding domain-containing protein [Lysobacter alkalisoli]